MTNFKRGKKGIISASGEQMVELVFDKKVNRDVLALLGKTVDTDGYIVELEKPSQRVLTFDGQEIKVSEFGGVQKGSEVFIKDNLISLIKLSKR